MISFQPLTFKGGGQICSMEIKIIISLVSNVRLTSNWAVNSSLSKVLSKQLENWAIKRPWRSHFRQKSAAPYDSTTMSKKCSKTLKLFFSCNEQLKK